MGDGKEICVNVALAQGISEELLDRISGKARRIIERNDESALQVSQSQMGLKICGNKDGLMKLATDLAEEVNDDKDIMLTLLRNIK